MVEDLHRTNIQPKRCLLGDLPSLQLVLSKQV